MFSRSVLVYLYLLTPNVSSSILHSLPLKNTPQSESESRHNHSPQYPLQTLAAFIHLLVSHPVQNSSNCPNFILNRVTASWSNNNSFTTPTQIYCFLPLTYCGKYPVKNGVFPNLGDHRVLHWKETTFTRDGILGYRTVPRSPRQMQI